MNTTTATPPSLMGDFRRMMARLWADPESQSTMVGLLGVLIFYLLLWLFGPHLLDFHSVGSVVRPHASTQQFNIEIAPDTFTKPAPKPPPFKFVETNPNAPENTPDKTTNFAERNQQVAQEKPTPDGKSDRPALEGKKDFASTQIVDGRLSKPIEQVEAVPPPVETRVAETTVTAPKLEQNPLPGTERKQGENIDSFGSNVAKFPENAKPIPEKIEGEKNVPLVEGATATTMAIDPQHPRPRPQVVTQINTRPAIFAENKFGTDKIGNIAVDAKWSNYGVYLHRMIEAVQIQWEKLLDAKTYPPSGSYVTVKFILDSKGNIAKIVEVDNHSSEQGERACASAITDRASFGPWTDDMIALLGEQQEMTFTFYYQ
jgi:hypothetical protein